MFTKNLAPRRAIKSALGEIHLLIESNHFFHKEHRVRAGGNEVVGKMVIVR